MINLRNFIQWLGLAPLIAAAPKMLDSPSPKVPKMDEPQENRRKLEHIFGTVSPMAEGIYTGVYAAENLQTGDLVILDVGHARKWNGVGQPNGIAIRPLDKGYYGWIQTKS